MALIREFIEDYRGKISHFQHLAEVCAYQCESALKRQGLRVLVTSRAKRLDSLASKVEDRAQEKNYQSIEEIYDDIVDLAGVRIALFFPQDQREVDQFIRSNFKVDSVKDFPEALGHPGAYPKQFLGYVGRHYRLYLKPDSLPPEERHLAEHVIEVQVGTVLMHAWAEVEHDLVYKSTGAFLSQDEYAILDELNGLMYEGEMALERLQTAAKRRINAEQQPFSNHYELSSYLNDQKRRALPGPECRFSVGRTDVLFQFLKTIGLNSVPALRPILQACSFSPEEEPLAQQIVDHLLVGDADLYREWDQARITVGAFDPFGTLYETVSCFSEDGGLGAFMRSWIAVEQVLGETLYKVLKGEPSDLVLDACAAENLRRAKQLRNQILFSCEPPSPEELERDEEFLRGFMDFLRQELAEPSLRRHQVR
jgi:ppGpp synthetase/RelA/SpoT-type nucleotidyltranferase